ncbi:hypothetical protein GCM10029978_004760 [Actinoallomurus acanthiterrae]
MTVRRPGRPEDLPSAEVIWARWAALAAVLSTPGAGRPGYRLDDDGLHLDTVGSTWAAMTWRGDGRAVLFGEDHAGGTKWHEPPVDVLAGAPDWLPYERLEDHLEAGELGFVYWYEEATWRRAPYPPDLEDDGIATTLGRFAVRSDTAWEMESRLRERIPRTNAPLQAACARLLTYAERRAVTAGIVRGFAAQIGWPDADVTAISTAARRAGLTRPAR